MIRRIYHLLKNFIARRSAYRFFIKDWRHLGDVRKCADAVSTMRHSQNLEPTLLEYPDAERIFVIAPHPDDEVLGPGGTLLKAIKGGSRVRVLYLTKGRPALAETVVSEATRSAAKAGYEQVFLECYSRCIPMDKGYLKQIRQEIEGFLPTVIMLPFFCDDHDDHRRASHLLYVLNEQKALDKKIQLWAYQVYTSLIPNVVIDITEVADSKRELITYWQSQSKNRDWAHYALGLNAYNSRFLPPNSSARFAEGFFVVPIADYCEIAAEYFTDVNSSYYLESYKNRG